MGGGAGLQDCALTCWCVCHLSDLLHSTNSSIYKHIPTLTTQVVLQVVQGVHIYSLFTLFPVFILTHQYAMNNNNQNSDNNFDTPMNIIFDTLISRFWIQFVWICAFIVKSCFILWTIGLSPPQFGSILHVQHDQLLAVLVTGWLVIPTTVLLCRQVHDVVPWLYVQVWTLNLVLEC